MKLAFDFDTQDWRIYLREVWLTSREHRRRRLILRLLLPIGLLMMLFGFAWHPGQGFELADWGIVALAVAWALFSPLLVDFGSMRAMMRQVKAEGNRNLFGRRELELAPEEVTSISAMGTMHYKAGAILEVRVTPGLLLLFVAELQAIVIPRAKIAEGEWEATVKFAKAHYGIARDGK